MYNVTQVYTRLYIYALTVCGTAQDRTRCCRGARSRAGTVCHWRDVIRERQRSAPDVITSAAGERHLLAAADVSDTRQRRGDDSG